MNKLNKLNYPCDKTPNGLCIDCTNDGPLCDFDECKYMSLNREPKLAIDIFEELKNERD